MPEQPLIHTSLTVDRQVALDAAELVSVTYRDVKKPILTIEEAQRAGSYFPNQTQPITKGNPDSMYHRQAVCDWMSDNWMNASDWIGECTWMSEFESVCVTE